MWCLLFSFALLPHNWQRFNASDVEWGVFVPGGLGLGPLAARRLNPGYFPVCVVMPHSDARNIWLQALSGPIFTWRVTRVCVKWWNAGLQNELTGPDSVMPIMSTWPNEDHYLVSPPLLVEPVLPLQVSLPPHRSEAPLVIQYLGLQKHACQLLCPRSRWVTKVGQQHYLVVMEDYCLWKMLTTLARPERT